MKLSSFFKLVEIQTKVASVIPFLLAFAYTIYAYGAINLLILGLYFISMVSVDMATTAMNNYMDFKNAKIKVGYNYEEHNAIVRDGLSMRSVKMTILSLLILGAGCGFFVYLLTDVVVLLVGFLAFGVGIVYSFGPVPISRTPLGEVFSGVLMGGLIFFVGVYSQIYERGIIVVHLSNGVFTLNMHLMPIFKIVLVSIPLIMGIANIMLANNICDLEEDIKNNRHTLPYYIGVKKSLSIFDINTYGPFVAIIFASLLGVVPFTALISILALIPMIKGVKQFHQEQIKGKTFIIAVKHFILTNVLYFIGIMLGVVLQWLI